MVVAQRWVFGGWFLLFRRNISDEEFPSLLELLHLLEGFVPDSQGQGTRVWIWDEGHFLRPGCI